MEGKWNTMVTFASCSSPAENLRPTSADRASMTIRSATSSALFHWVTQPTFCLEVRSRAGLSAATPLPTRSGLRHRSDGSPLAQFCAPMPTGYP